MADHLGVAHLRRQMADPAAHQVEQYAAVRQGRPVQFGQCGDRAVVDMQHEARRLVEEFVLFRVEFGEGA